VVLLVADDIPFDAKRLDLDRLIDRNLVDACLFHIILALLRSFLSDIDAE
jgi:hypothetical protein